MGNKSVIVCAVISLAMLVIGYIWKTLDAENYVALLLFFLGWIASLLVGGYMSTPSNSLAGKIGFGFVCIIVAGIVMKILHLPMSNETIIGGLSGLGITYLVIWLKSRKA